MKKRIFHILDDPRFHLLYGVSQRFTMGPMPQKVRLNREGFDLLDEISKNSLVYPYMRLAVHPDLGKGDLFAPIYGKITEINARSILVEAIDPDEHLQELGQNAAKNTTDILSHTETGEDLAIFFKRRGLNTKSLAKSCKTLIINGLNPDPGVTWAEPMLLTHRDELLNALQMLKRLSPAEKIILAVPEQLYIDDRFKELVEIARVSAFYPASINPLVIKAVTGQENPAGVAIVGLHNLWSLGRIVTTGLPLIETVLTLGSLYHSGNYIVRDGSLIHELLDFVHIELHDGDTLVRGGPLRGESLDRLDRSVTKGATGIFVVEAGTVPPMIGHSPCINCGACVNVCPARLDPGILSRHAEFALHERNLKENINCCFECGLCGYVCIARRPVLQYIRLSKHNLQQMKKN